MSDNYLLHKRILVVDDEQALLDMICMDFKIQQLRKVSGKH